MEFIDLKSQQKTIRSGLDSRIKKILDDGRYILGEEVRSLESELSLFSKSKYSITCANGTDALMLALMALDIGPGDGVITIPFTYIATLEAIAAVGATPVLVDVYDSTFNMNPDLIEDAIKKSDKKIKAIMPVDLFGLPARYRMINDIAKKYNIKVIADSAQSFGASKNQQKVGTFGDITTTSFFPAKPLGCYGDGGALFTDSEDIKNKLESLRVHGKGVDKYDNIRIGMNSRLDTLQAGILLEKINIFSKEIIQRNAIADKYRSLLQGLPLKFQHIPEGYESVYAQFSIVFENEKTRDSIQKNLSKHKVPSVVYYGISGHLQTGYKYLNYKLGDFPVSETLSNTILSLPMHPYLLEKDIVKITNIIKDNF
ncbi:DegT/DnrJ/EryC1/StrS family aminotransferase [Candidatus Marinimicrobia bacterium]|nr:DegT/DnrJ/EryC1/StrS family aminotransferase [Candidatus Neomarinimicrobiota bacterium]